MFENLPAHSFDVDLADPPWSYYGSTDGWGDAAKFYPLLDDEDLFEFPMRDLLNRRSVLFLRATCPCLDVAMRCIERWGLHFRGVAFVWVKTKADGTPIGAQTVLAPRREHSPKPDAVQERIEEMYPEGVEARTVRPPPQGRLGEMGWGRTMSTTP